MYCATGHVESDAFAGYSGSAGPDGVALLPFLGASSSTYVPTMDSSDDDPGWPAAFGGFVEDDIPFRDCPRIDSTFGSRLADSTCWTSLPADFSSVLGHPDGEFVPAFSEINVGSPNVLSEDDLGNATVHEFSDAMLPTLSRVVPVAPMPFVPLHTIGSNQRMRMDIRRHRRLVKAGFRPGSVGLPLPTDFITLLKRSREILLWRSSLCLLALPCTYTGNIIEGCVPQDINTFREKLKEGLVYKIERFLLAGQKTKHRAARHPLRVRLGISTNITEVTSQLAHFPLYMYNIKPFGELEKHIGDITYVSDAIGIAIKQTDIIPSKSDQDPMRQIRIQNEDGRIAIVTLWGKHAEDFDAQYLYEQSVEQNMVILFTGVVVSYFQGMLAFGSTSLTRWHFDPQIPETEFLHNSIGDQHFIVEWDGHDVSTLEPSDTTLYALGNEDPENIIPQNWWFHSCKDCRKGMASSANIRKCPKCGKTESQQRYKLCVDAVDIEPNNEDKITTGRFMFYGDEAAAVIGKDIALLLAQAKSKPNLIPPAITATVGKKCAFTARTSSPRATSSQPTTKHNSETFTPTDICAQAENTPVKEVLDQPITSTEEGSVDSSKNKKRKATASATTSTSSEKEGHTARKLDLDSTR